MNKSANQNYNYLFRYIIVGDMGKIKISKIQLLESLVYYYNSQIINFEINMS